MAFRSWKRRFKSRVSSRSPTAWRMTVPSSRRRGAAASASVSGLIALAKAKPGVLNYSSAAPGTTSQLGAELFKAMTGVNIVRLGFTLGWLTGAFGAGWFVTRFGYDGMFLGTAVLHALSMALLVTGVRDAPLPDQAGGATEAQGQPGASARAAQGMLAASRASC